MTTGHFEAQGIVKTFEARGESRTILPGVSLTLRPGEILALLGPSGCGKTTLLNILAGFSRPDAGRIRLDGKPCRSPGPQRAVVFQEDALFPWLTALENVTIGLRAAGKDKTAGRTEAERMLARVGLGGFERHLPKTLSGGMRQRLALARVLALDPKVLLMDEPFASLDALTRDQMHELLVALHGSTNISILFVTHDVSEAVRLADTIVVMGKAGQGVVRRFPIPLPRPRARTDGVCLAIEEDIRNILRHGNTKRPSPPAPPPAGPTVRGSKPT
uniref:ABC-type nitrate/sulfonate/bicarbonate transport system, ATPase component n=1 Tax=Desulfovibrio sp. U5L TaxID=596152 RepID=I2Q6V2_9BACT